MSSSEDCTLEEVRALALAKLQQLQNRVSSSDDDVPLGYWLGRGNGTNVRRPVEPGASQRCRVFQSHGFVHVPGFVAPSECDAMKREMARLVRERWKPHHHHDDDNDDDPTSSTSEAQFEAFGTDARQNEARSDYFLDSADRVHFFAEPAALLAPGEGGDDDPNQKDRCENGAPPPPPRLRPEYQGDHAIQALNKAGHALHLEPGIFHQYSTSAAVLNLVEELGWKDPVVPQSMYIFKQAHTGGIVHSHQDSTFLYTTPYQSCLGLWLALDDATLTNGCLWVRPGSHTEPVRRQYVRNPAHFQPNQNDAPDPSVPKFLMQDLYDESHSVTWDGSLPDGGMMGLLDAGFVPIECQSGDLVCFGGTLDHLSLENASDEARHTFQLHLVEGPSEGVQWGARNWLQYPEGKPFLRLNCWTNKNEVPATEL